MAANTSPSAVRNTQTGYMWVFYQDSNSELRTTYWEGGSWSSQELGTKMAASASPAAVRLPDTNHFWVFYKGSNGSLWMTYEPGTGWGAKELGLEML